MATYAEIQTRVQRRVIDLPSAVQAEIPALINEAMKELQRAHQFKIQEALLEATTDFDAAGQVLVSRPADWMLPHGRPYYTPQEGRSQPMDYIADRGRAEKWYGDTEGPPIGLLEGESSDQSGSYSFSVWPIPDQLSDYDDGEYRVKIPYWRWLTALSADGDTNFFTIWCEEALIAMAAAEAFFLDWDEEKGTLWKQLALQKLQPVIRLDKLSGLTGMETWVPEGGAR